MWDSPTPCFAQQPAKAFRISFHSDGVILLDAKANDKPTVRVPHYNRQAFIAEASLVAASKTADAITTRQVLDRGGWENNPIFGRHPSPAKQSLINLGIFGAQAGLLYPGLVERESLLFRYTEANPQGEMYPPVRPRKRRE